MMDRALEAGINVFDTADAYGGGRSEAYIGRWLKGRGSSVRDQLLLSSKVFNPVARARTTAACRAATSCARSSKLPRLRTDRLDMYLIHEPDPRTPLDETLRALDDAGARGQGALHRREQHRGLADGAGARDQRERGPGAFEWVQNSYSLLDRGAEREMFPLCADRASDSPRSARSPAVADRQVPGGQRVPRRIAHDAAAGAVPSSWRRMRCSAVSAPSRTGARARGVDVSALALAWVLHHPRDRTLGDRRPAPSGPPRHRALGAHRDADGRRSGASRRFCYRLIQRMHRAGGGIPQGPRYSRGCASQSTGR